MPTRQPANVPTGGSSQGPAIDAAGTPIVDPTSNVLQLVEAAVKRLDDLRAAEARRQDELNVLRTAHLAEVHNLTMSFQGQLREAEAKRIDAIRAVDVSAVTVASSRAADQASVLAAQVQVSADALRALVTSTAATMAQQSQAQSLEFSKRIAELERAKFEGAGKQAVIDPQIAELLAEVRTLRAGRSTDLGKVEGISASWAFLVAAVGLAGTIWALVSR